MSKGAAKHDLGVLFVHGIGSPKYADTLLSCGEPFLDALSQWTEGAGDPGWRISPDAAVLRPASGSEDDPAWSSVEVGDPNGKASQSWLLAESWWSTAFAPPSYGRLASWTSQIAPWAVAFWARRQFESALTSMTIGVVRDYERRKEGQWGLTAGFIGFGLSWWRIIKLLLRVFTFLLALLLIPLLIAIVLLLLVVGLLPIPQLRSFIRNVQSRLTNSIGDSFVLVSSPLQAAAIETRVEQSLNWLADRAEKIVVVAHSQGAAIAHRVIRHLPSGKRPQVFVSLGSGLKQLTAIEVVQLSGRKWHPLLPAIGLLLLAYSMRDIYRIAAGGPGVDTSLTSVTTGAYIAVLAMLLVQVIAIQEHPLLVVVFQLGVAAVVPFLAFAPAERLTGWFAFGGLALLIYGVGRFDPSAIAEEELSLADDVRWLDFYSTHDPVPNGALFDDPSDHFILESYEIHNRASVVSDHVAYWSNSEGFVLPAAIAIAKAADIGAASGDHDDSARIQVAHYRRRWRVRWLTWLRGILFAAFAGLLWVGWDDEVLEAGESTWDWFRSAYDVLPFVTAENLQSELGQGARRLAGAVTVLIGVLLVYAVVVSVWKLWDRHDRATLFGRGKFPVFSWPMLAYVAVLVLSVAGALAAIDGWSDEVSTAATWVTFGVVAVPTLAVAIWKWRNWSRSGDAQQVLRIRAGHLKGQLDAVTELSNQRERAWAGTISESLRSAPRAPLDPARAVIVYSAQWKRLEWTATMLSQEAEKLAACIHDQEARMELLEAAAHHSRWAPAAVMLAREKARRQSYEEAYEQLKPYEDLSPRVSKRIEAAKSEVHDIEEEE